MRFIVVVAVIGMVIGCKSGTTLDPTPSPSLPLLSQSLANLEVTGQKLGEGTPTPEELKIYSDLILRDVEAMKSSLKDQIKTEKKNLAWIVSLEKQLDEVAVHQRLVAGRIGYASFALAVVCGVLLFVPAVPKRVGFVGLLGFGALAGVSLAFVVFWWYLVIGGLITFLMICGILVWHVWTSHDEMLATPTSIK